MSVTNTEEKEIPVTGNFSIQSSAVLIFTLCLYENLFCSSDVICILCNTKELDSKGECAGIQLRLYESIAARLILCNISEV